MPKQTRALFTCTNVNHFAYGQQVRLDATYDTSIPEEQRFCEASPSGHMEIFVNNAAVHGFFVPGHKYHLDITPHTEEKTVIS